MGNYKEAKIGFGAGSNIKTSILQAIYDCPFIGAGVKVLIKVNMVTVLILVSFRLIKNSVVFFSKGLKI